MPAAMRVAMRPETSSDIARFGQLLPMRGILAAMSEPVEQRPVHDRALLLLGRKRNEILTLEEVRQYGIDSFGDADYLHIYGMAPAAWYRRGIRLLGRTVVECTRDELGDRIGRDIADLAAKLRPARPFIVLDPFAGSCNTLFWILRHFPDAAGIACELDPRVHALSQRNMAGLDARIELAQGDYQAMLEGRRFAAGQGLVVFVAPPWGAALDEVAGLDLRRTTPPVTEIIGNFARRYADHSILFATQVFARVDPASLADVQHLLDWSQLRMYDLDPAGRNHGILLGTKGWQP
jgi:hypothetical protein